WKNVIIFDHPSHTWSWADVRRTAPQFCGPKFMDTGAHSCSDRWCSVRHFSRVAFTPGDPIRRLDGEAVGGRRLARAPPRRVTRTLAASTIALPAPALSSTGDDSRPHHVILDRKIAARLFGRSPRPVEAKIMPDSYVSSMVLPSRRPHNQQLRTAMVTA